MVGIYGIGELPGPANAVSAQATGKRPDTKLATLSSDTVSFSQAAEDLSVVLFAKQNAANDEFRQERIEEARQNLQKGLHQVQGLIEVVASRISRYVESEV
ncbi:MAG: hypothetical protein AMXMBFR84_05310 [Candidatus Hydrogenedentota bacterium]